MSLPFFMTVIVLFQWQSQGTKEVADVMENISFKQVGYPRDQEMSGLIAFQGLC